MLTTKQLAETLREMTNGEYYDATCITYGPFEAPVYKVENKYRMRMVVKCILNKRSREMFAHLLLKFSHPSSGKVTVGIDFNPSNL